MKKVIASALMASIVLVAGCAQEDSNTAQELRDNSNGSKYQVFNIEGTDTKHTDYFNSIPYNDDFNFSTYEIDEVNDNEIFGDAIKSLDSSNNDGGIFLDANELDEVIEAGDKVMVVFENGHDDAIVDVKIIE